MRIKFLALSLFFCSAASAQDFNFSRTLIPYQVQNLKSWDQKKLWGYKNSDFAVVIPPVNEAPVLFSDGYVVLKKNGKYGLMDEKGNIVLQPQYARCSAVQNGFIEVEDEGATNGGYVISLRTKEKFGYDNSLFGTSTSLSGYAGLFIIKQANTFNPFTYGLSDSTGKTVFPIIYSDIKKLGGATYFGLFRVQDNTKQYGMIDEKGNWLIHPKYDSIGQFTYGLARVCLNKKYGYIDISGKAVIPVQYDAAADFSTEGSIAAFINDEPIYTGVKLGSEGFFVDQKGNTYFKGKGLKEAISENNKWFIVRANNDSVYM